MKKPLQNEFDQAKFTFGLIVCRRGIKASVCFKFNASQSYHQSSVVNRFHDILMSSNFFKLDRTNSAVPSSIDVSNNS